MAKDPKKCAPRRRRVTFADCSPNWLTEVICGHFFWRGYPLLGYAGAGGAAPGLVAIHYLSMSVGVSPSTVPPRSLNVSLRSLFAFCQNGNEENLHGRCICGIFPPSRRFRCLHVFFNHFCFPSPSPSPVPAQSQYQSQSVRVPAFFVQFSTFLSVFAVRPSTTLLLTICLPFLCVF